MDYTIIVGKVLSTYYIAKSSRSYWSSYRKKIMYERQHVLVIYDDFVKQAQAYRHLFFAFKKSTWKRSLSRRCFQFTFFVF